MYSSTDLVNWKNLGQQASSVSGMWRPKIAKPNGSYWVSKQEREREREIKRDRAQFPVLTVKERRGKSFRF